MDFSSEVSIGLRRNIKESLRAALSRLSSPLGVDADIESIIIKPSIFDLNLPGNTTLEMLKSVVKLFSNVAPIYIIESDNPRRTAMDAFEGIGVIPSDIGVNIVNISTSEIIDVDLDGLHFKRIGVPKILRTNSIIINLGTAKFDPSQNYYSGSVKNLFGLIPEPAKRKYHEVLNEVLVDLLRVYKPDLNIIELTEVAIGPRLEAVSRSIGGVIVGASPVSVDAFCAMQFGLDPIQIPYLQMAHELGLGEILPERLKISGTDHQKQELSKRFCEVIYSRK